MKKRMRKLKRREDDTGKGWERVRAGRQAAGRGDREGSAPRRAAHIAAGRGPRRLVLIPWAEVPTQPRTQGQPDAQAAEPLSCGFRHLEASTAGGEAEGP